jgi:putative DNA primase/helicase
MRVTAQQIADSLDARPAGRARWIARCPAHDDRTPSLSIVEGHSGKAVLHCHAGCTYDAVRAAIPLLASREHRRMPALVRRPRTRKYAPVPQASVDALAAFKGHGVEDGSHPYIKQKQIRTIDGLRRDRRKLLIPMYNEQGALANVQSIPYVRLAGSRVVCPKKKRRFLSGVSTKGLFLQLGDAGDRVWIAEGYATGATVHELSGDAVLVAFSSGNLAATAVIARRKFPKVEIVMAADNDATKERNAGVEAGT